MQSKPKEGSSRALFLERIQNTRLPDAIGGPASPPADLARLASQEDTQRLHLREAVPRWDVCNWSAGSTQRPRAPPGTCVE